MSDKTRRALSGIGKVLCYGTLAAAGLGVIVFAFGFLGNGLDPVQGFEWCRRILFILGALCIVVGGVGLLFSGNEYQDSRLGFASDDALRSFKSVAGISWAWALVVASVGFLGVGTLAELALLALS